MIHKPRLSRPARLALAAGTAFATTLALGLDLCSQLPAKAVVLLREGGPTAILNNLIVMLNQSFTMDHLTGLALAVACTLLYRRFLMPSGRAGKKGEYLLCAFLTLTMLVSEAMLAEETLACLWAGGFQVLKSCLYFAGVFPLFLTGLRMLRAGLRALRSLAPLREGTLWARHPFAAPLCLMALAWTPCLLMKYPCGMSPDATVQIQAFVKQSMDLSHPAFATVAYGMTYRLGQWLGDANLGYFLFTLAQTACFLCVLAFSCARMRAYRVPRALYAAILAVYCVVPNYSGWTTCMVKDVPYLIGCLLLSVLLIDFCKDSAAFLSRKRNLALLALAWLTIWLWRKNGVGMVLAVGLCMVGFLAATCRDRKALGRVAGVLLAVSALSLATNAALAARYDMSPGAKRELYSPMLQATARVVALHDAELGQDEKEIIDRVATYDRLAKGYNPILTDGVKRYFKEDASEAEYRAYRELFWQQLARYPLDNVDAFLNVTYRVFDIRSDRGHNIGAREISHPYYIRSYSNELYDQDALQGLNVAQETVENFDFFFADLPLAGLLVNIGFCVDVLLMMAYLLCSEGRKRALGALLPSIITVIFCLLSPLVYIRYAVPMTAALPLWFVAYWANGASSEIPTETRP